jgi:two-component system, OmpR family, alkaline phosphatase synthesis response regulator PhoP
MPRKVLVIEDNPDIASVVSLHLKSLGCRVEWVDDGERGLKRAISEKFDLVVLDVVLPGMDGLEICREIRRKELDVAILMLTEKSEELDKVLGLELGADDYLTKPFGVREFLARVKALFRRTEEGARMSVGGSKKQLRFADLAIDLEKRKVIRKGKPVELTAKEFDLLTLLASHPGKCYTRHQLLESVWGYKYEGYDHTINTHINRLRGKIEDDPDKPRYIKTMRGVGYRMADPEELE